MLKSKRARAGAILATGVVASSVGLVALGGGPGSEALGVASVIGGTCSTASGPILSDTTVAGHKGWWPIGHITDGIQQAFDPASGLPTGRHQEQGIRISMNASPALIGLGVAVSTAQVLPTCDFYFYRPSVTGVETQYFHIHLVTVRVTSYSLDASPTGGATTQFTFIPQRITRTWITGNKSFSDDWNLSVG